MFDKYTFKQKNKVLLIIFVLLMLASYKRSFVLTLLALDEIEKQELNIEKIKTSDYEIGLLNQSIKELNQTIGKSNLKPDKVQQKILKEISILSQKNDVNLESIEETHIYKTVDFSIYSNILILEGDYKNLVKSIYNLELNFEYARLINVQLYKEKNISTKKIKLYAKILFQHYHQV